MTVRLSLSSGIKRFNRLSKWRIVPTTLHIPVLDIQGSNAPKNQRLNFSRLSLLSTCSSPSKSSQTIKSGLIWFHFNPRTRCSAPLTKTRKLYPSLNSTMISVSVSLINLRTPNNSIKSSLFLSSSLISFKKLTACVSVSDTMTANFLSLNNKAARV